MDVLHRFAWPLRGKYIFCGVPGDPTKAKCTSCSKTCI